jgi:hypothetical protein
MAARRSYGTGSLIVRSDHNGRGAWYGKWRANGRQVMRKIGPKRGGEAKDGLTVLQAEAELRRLIAETSVRPVVGELLTVAEVGRRYLARMPNDADGSPPRAGTSRARYGSTSCRSSGVALWTRSALRT